MEAKKGKMRSSGKNDILAQSLGKAPKCGHMQGVGKFVTPSLYFQTCQRPADRDRQREDRLWRESINRQLEEMRNELRKTPRHSDIASSSYPRVPGENNNVVGDDGIESVQAEAVAETTKVSLFTIFLIISRFSLLLDKGCCSYCSYMLFVDLVCCMFTIYTYVLSGVSFDTVNYFVREI